MIRKTKRRGGMRAVLKPLGQTTLTIGKEYGKDYLQKKFPSVTKGIYNEPSLASNTQFLLTGKKTDFPPPKLNIYNNENNKYNKYNIENNNSNIMIGGKTKRHKRTKRNKRRKTIKNIK